MKYPSRRFKRVAVLGAGVMGAQIAAHLANARIPVLLYELPAEGDDPNANVVKAISSLSKLKPAPFADVLAAKTIVPANYAQDLEKLRDCDLVIEAISERLDWKHELYKKIIPHLSAQAILASNTSGISLDSLSEPMSPELKQRFCGVHFFNPPRYMHLLELIPHSTTQAEILDDLEYFLTSSLGKGVIRTKDTPSFIGNRVGVFSILAVLHHAERLQIPLDLVDKLTGPGIGRPKSATCRTADVVGLDTLAHVVNSMRATLSDDPWRDCYKIPEWMQSLIEAGALGQKSGQGIYKKVGKEIQVLDPIQGDYRPVQSWLDPKVREILKNRNPAEKFAALKNINHPQAEFLRAIHLDLFHYASVLLAEIAHSARDVDLAMRWGYGWQLGPFEIWQAAGWQAIVEMLEDALESQQTLSKAPLPKWIKKDERSGVHARNGSWSADKQGYIPRSEHPVYARQQRPERVFGEAEPAAEIVFEDDAVRCWHSRDEILVLSFKTKMHTVSNLVLQGIHRALDTAEAEYKALVLWQNEAPFCAGANLKDAMTSFQAGDVQAVVDMVTLFQQTSLRLRYSTVPTVAATQGLVFGGGCEFMLHSDRTVAALESYVGLVEAGVGLLPGAGGCKEMALRASVAANGADVFPFLAKNFETIAMAKVAGSALEAREFGYLRPEDKVIFNSHELLYVAKREAEALHESGYRPPLSLAIRVAGDAGIATLKAQMVNMLQGGFISEHDYFIGSKIAHVLCGGEVHPGSEVSEDWLLRLEIDTFMELVQHPKSQARIQHTMTTGKPLRN